MRFEKRVNEALTRIIGAAVVRPDGSGLVIEFGPADGPPHIVLRMSKNEAAQLIAGLRSVSAGGDEEIILTEE